MLDISEARVILVEAIDQPWKTNEGGVGPYWGLYNAAREPKFAWYGTITASRPPGNGPANLR